MTQSLVFEYANQAKELRYSENTAQSPNGDLFEIGPNLSAHLSREPFDFFSHELILPSFPPISITLSISSTTKEASFDEDWSDSGELWNFINDLTGDRVLGKTFEPIGTLTVQSANSEQNWKILDQTHL